EHVAVMEDGAKSFDDVCGMLVEDVLTHPMLVGSKGDGATGSDAACGFDVRSRVTEDELSRRVTVEIHREQREPAVVPVFVEKRVAARAEAERAKRVVR